MGVEEESHSLRAEVAVPVLLPGCGVDLGVSVKISHTLHIHHNQLVTRSLKSEMAECL